MIIGSKQIMLNKFLGQLEKDIGYREFIEKQSVMTARRQGLVPKKVPIHLPSGQIVQGIRYVKTEKHDKDNDINGKFSKTPSKEFIAKILPLLDGICDIGKEKYDANDKINRMERNSDRQYESSLGLSFIINQFQILESYMIDFIDNRKRFFELNDYFFVIENGEIQSFAKWHTFANRFYIDDVVVHPKNFLSTSSPIREDEGRRKSFNAASARCVWQQTQLEAGAPCIVRRNRRSGLHLVHGAVLCAYLPAKEFEH